MYWAFSKKGTLFKGGHYLRKYGIHYHPKQKGVFKCYDEFLRALSEKLPKWHVILKNFGQN